MKNEIMKTNEIWDRTYLVGKRKIISFMNILS